MERDACDRGQDQLYEPLGRRAGRPPGWLLRLLGLLAGVTITAWLAQARVAYADVGPDGTYSTSVQIEVPAFRGLEPEVSLTYNSDSPDGLAGPGWGLTATSFIVRTGPQGGTPAYDDAADVFVLDGTELIPCSIQQSSVSPSCAAGGTHSAKQENYLRIRREGANWEITAKDGTRSIYTPQHIGDAVAVFRWGLSRRIDTHGNEVGYDYDCDGTRECYASEITYGSSPGPLQSKIVFHYEERPDVRTYATGKDLGVVTRRLKTVEVRNAGAPVRAYSLGYRPPLGADRARLEKVQQWGRDARVAKDGTVTPGSTPPLPDRTFRVAGGDGWDRHAASGSFAGPWPDNGGVSGAKDWNGAPLPGLVWQNGVRVQWFPCDHDADGRQDMLGVGREANGTLSLRVAQSNRDGTYRSQFQLTSWSWGNAMSPEWRAMPGDVTADGRCDVVFARWDSAAHRVVLYAAVSGASASLFALSPGVPTGVDEWSPQSRWFVADASGDDRGDVMAALHHHDGGTNKDEARLFVALSTGGGGFDPRPVVDTSLSHRPEDAAHWFVGDFDGDDRADLAHVRQDINPFDTPVYSAGVDEALSLGDGMFRVRPGGRVGVDWINNVTLPDVALYGEVGTDLVQSGDFNGDGLTDLLLVGEKPVKLPPTEFPKIRLFTLFSTGRGGFRVIQSDTDLPMEYTNLWFSSQLKHETYPNQWLSGDWDGDTATDVAVLTPVSYRNANWPTMTRVTWLHSNKDGTFRILRPPPTSWPHDCPGRSSGPRDWVVCPDGLTGQYFLTDITGDGQADLTGVLPRITASGDRIASFRVQGTWNTDGRDSHNWRDVDITGDGNADRLYVKYTNPGLRVYTAISAGSGFGQIQSTDVLPGFDDRATNHCLTIDVGGPDDRADGRADLVCPYSGSGGVRVYTLLSTGDGGWKPAPSNSGVPWKGASFEDVWSLKSLDVDGDGDTDLARTSASAAGVTIQTLLSGGDGTWFGVDDVQFKGAGEDDGPNWRVGDFNGDGRFDLTHVHFDGASAQVVRTLLSRGDGRWKPVAQLLALPASDSADWKQAELNGDGKLDLLNVAAQEPTIANGKITGHLRIDQLTSRGNGAWEATSATVDLPGEAGPSDSASFRVLDLDDDGLTDLATVHASASRLRVWALLNRHGSWASSIKDVSTATWDLGIPTPDVRNWQIGDGDANGRDDLLITRKDATSVRFLTLRSGYDDGRLLAHTNELGGLTEITYRSSAGAHALMPAGGVRRLVDTVKLTARPPVPPSKPVVADTFSYAYDGARWSYAERRFLGFATVTRIDGHSRTVTGYAQTPGCAMSPVQETVGPPSGGVLARTHYVYDDASAKSAPPYRCEQRQVLQEECEGTSSCRTISTRLDHDAYGNVTRMRQDGRFTDADGDEQDDQPDDNREQVVEYVPNLNRYIVAAPAAVEVLDASNTPAARVSRSRFVYDANSAYNQAPVTGDVASVEAWDDRANKYVVTTIGHDGYGNVTKVTDPTGRWTRTDYDPTYGVFPVAKCNAALPCERQDWDYVLGKPTDSTDPNSQVTYRKYDDHARVRHIRYPDGGCEDYTYPDWGTAAQRVLVQLCLSSTNRDQLGLPVEQYVDGLGRTVRIRRPSGAEKTMTFLGATSRIETATDWTKPGGTPTGDRYTYDALQRPVFVHHADGSVAQIQHAVGSETRIDELKHEQTVFRDGFGRVERVREFVTENGKLVAHDTTYVHDALDRLSKIIDPRNNATTTDWDSLSRRRSSCDPDLGCWTSGYDDDDGRPDWQLDARQQRIEFKYDTIGRLTEKLYDPLGPAPRSARWFYDTDPATSKPQGHSIGRVTRTESPLGASSDRPTYDEMGRVTNRTVCVHSRCAETKTTYDVVGRPASITYPDSTGALTPASEVVGYHYDPGGQLERVDGYVTSMKYNAHDQLEELRYTNDIVTVLAYDPKRLWLDTERVEDPAHNLKYDSDYDYDTTGRMTSRTTHNPGLEQQGFGYDELGRLTTVTGTQPQTFRYDELGNMTYNSSVGDYLYTDPKHVHAVTATKGVAKASYAYDDNGNLFSGAGRTLVWNPDNLPSSITTPSGTTTFEYDADGQRVRKAGPNGTVDYLGPLVEFDAAGRIVTHYYAGSRLLATRTGPNVVFHSQDVLGSPRLTTNEVGTVTGRWDYAPYGTPSGSSGPAGGMIGFAGNRPDDETGLVYMNARYYDPQLARFISGDTIIPRTFDPQALNRYAYAFNDPLDFTDRTGHDPFWIHQRIETEDYSFDIQVNLELAPMTAPPGAMPLWQPPVVPNVPPVDIHPGHPGSPGGPNRPLEPTPFEPEPPRPPRPPPRLTDIRPAVPVLTARQALGFAVEAARLGALGILTWSLPAGDPVAHGRFLALQEADRIIREPLRNWVPIGEESPELPVLEPVSRPPSYLPPVTSGDPFVDPELPGSPGQLDLATGWEKHHVFPRGGGILELYFEQKGINIHDYTVKIGTEHHQAIHSAGYNDEWWRIVTSPNWPSLTREDVFKIGGRLKSKYGIVGPYEPW